MWWPLPAALTAIAFLAWFLVWPDMTILAPASGSLFWWIAAAALEL